MLTLLRVLLAGEAWGEAEWVLRPLGGGGKSDWGGDGTFRPSISAASFSSVALRSATKSAMSASKSLSSSSWSDSGVRSRIILSITHVCNEYFYSYSNSLRCYSLLEMTSQ